MLEEKKETCCVCGNKAPLKCSHCNNHFCDEHYEKVVMTGNCCRGNEKDYE